MVDLLRILRHSERIRDEILAFVTNNRTRRNLAAGRSAVNRTPSARMTPSGVVGWGAVLGEGAV